MVPGSAARYLGALECGNMARKPQHFTSHSGAEIHHLFADAIGSLGERIAQPGREEQILAVTMDGVPFKSRPAELRKPGSAFYATSYTEAHATAGMLVDLGLAGDVVTVVRRDAPDIDVSTRDGSHLYVEHAMVVDEDAQRFSLAIDDTNILAEAATRNDRLANSVFTNGPFNIRLDALTTQIVQARFSIQALAAEILAVARRLTERVDLQRPDPAQYPLLDALGARVFYHPAACQTARPIELPAFHGNRAVLGTALRQILASKAHKSSDCDASCVPLWLLLTVDRHFDAGSHFQSAYEQVLRGVSWGRIERVVIQCSDGVTLAFDP